MSGGDILVAVLEVGLCHNNLPRNAALVYINTSRNNKYEVWIIRICERNLE